MPISETDARQNLEKLLADYHKLTYDERKEMSEASVVHQFIDRLLEEVLGWPIKDPAHYKYEFSTQVGRPDLTLMPESGGVIFIEAKRFETIKELEARNTLDRIIKPGQLALPGMAIDRTPEEQKAINYAFANGGTWAILTNFQKLRLFNARRDWLVLSFEGPAAYKDDFDLLWQLAYHNVLNGSLDQLSNQRYTEEVDTTYLAFINEWREHLAQDILAHPEANQWVFQPDGSINLALLRAVVQRLLDRLVIVRFAEDHLVMPHGTLRELYEIRQRNPYTFSMDRFLNQLFQQFNERHNSALFAPSKVDHASFSDEVLLPLIAKLYEVRYRAMPADILGNTYEQYLGKTLKLDNGSVTTCDNLETRKKQGSYYTPQVIVRYLVDNSLGRYLYATQNGKPDGPPVPGEKRKTSQDIRELRVLDSACGSGSFLIYAYYVLADFYESEVQRLEREFEERRRGLVAQGMTRAVDLRIELTPYTAELERIRDYPRLILETHLYGVDLDPQAAEIAVVNLMMRAMERRHHEKRLPLILNQNVKVGNSLIGLRYDDPRILEHQSRLAEIRRLRHRLVQTPSGPQHDQIIEDLAALTHFLTTKLNQHFAPHFTDPDRIHPFHWGLEFPEVFYNDDGSLRDQPGFTIIFSNPPWEILKPGVRDFFAYRLEGVWSKYSRQQADSLIEETLQNDPRTAREWNELQQITAEVTEYVGKAVDYELQGEGDTNTYKLFVERSLMLLQPWGRLGYVIPSGIYSDFGTLPLRKTLFYQGQWDHLLSFSNNRRIFPEVHASFKFVLIGYHKQGQTSLVKAIFRVTPSDAVGTEDFDEIVNTSSNFVNIPIEDIPFFSPNNNVLLEFKTLQDVAITRKIYSGIPLLSGKVENSWSFKISREFDMTNDRRWFSTEVQGWPVYEGRMVDQFDHRVAYWVSGRGRSAVWHYSDDPMRFSNDYPWRAQYYIAEDIAIKRQVQRYGAPKWRIGICDVTAPTNQRTLLAAILPMECGVGNTVNTAVVYSEKDETAITLYLVSVLNSLVFDYAIRFRVKLHINQFVLYENPLPRLNPGNPYFDTIIPRAARITCTRPEFADLWQSVMAEPWDASQAATDPAERQQLRDEIDALVAHLYGLSHNDFAHILTTFPLAFPDTPSGHARRVTLLAEYDRWAISVQDWSRQ